MALIWKKSITFIQLYCTSEHKYRANPADLPFMSISSQKHMQKIQS